MPENTFLFFFLNAWRPIQSLPPSLQSFSHLPPLFSLHRFSSFLPWLFVSVPLLLPALIGRCRMVSQHSSESLCKRPRATHSLFFLGSACHSLISFNSLIRSFAGGSSGIGRRQYSLMLSLVQRILLPPWLSVKVPYLATSHRHD